jgi:DNA-binding response OmpR family regulator
MNGMDGLELLKKLRRFRKTPVIFLSRMCSMNIMAEAYALGCNDILDHVEVSLRDILKSITYQLGMSIPLDEMEVVDKYMGSEDLLFKNNQSEEEGRVVIAFNGKRAYREGDYDIALYCLKKAYDLGFRDTWLYTTLAMIYMDNKDYDSAKDWLHEAQLSDPYNLLLIYALLAYYEIGGRVDKVKIFNSVKDELTHKPGNGYVINPRRVGIGYLDGLNVLLITSNKRWCKLIVDGIRVLGGNVYVTKRIPSTKFMEKKKFDVILLDVRGFEKYLYAFLWSCGVLHDIPIITLNNNRDEELEKKVYSLGVECHIDFSSMNTRGVIEVIKRVCDKDYVRINPRGKDEFPKAFKEN